MELWWRRQREKKGVLFFLVATVASDVFCLLLIVRHWLFDKGVLRQKRCAAFVVSVGNLVVGGSGKTPFLPILAKYFSHKRVGIISRGYRAEEKMKEPCFVQEIANSWRYFGDEPVLLEKWCKLPVVIAKKRIRGAKLLISQGVEVILLDDGMQHRKLYRDLEIVLLKGNDPFGEDALLPKGRLRELPKRLNRADLVVINGFISDEQMAKLRLMTSAPFLYVQWRVKEISNLLGRKISLIGEKVGVFAGVGDFACFLASVEDLGPEIHEQIELADHQPLTKEQLKKIEASLASDLRYWVCSEKDEVKLSDISYFLKERIVVIRSELMIEENEDALRDLIKKRLEVA